MLVNIIHQQHLELRELFTRHQEALLQGELHEALAWLENYDILQKAHMQIEENYLFPKFANIDHNSNWDVSLYQKEHDKIRHLYTSILNELTRLSEQQQNESQRRRDIIELLDKQKKFKGLNEHHAEREEEAMLKELEEQLEQRQLRELQHDIKMTWVEVKASIQQNDNC